MPSYETRSIARGLHYYRALEQGYKVCRGCDKMIKSEGTNCPFCSQKFVWWTSKKYAKEQREKAQQANKERHCSRCGSGKTKKANGYPLWLKDGQDGWLCEPCYRKRG
jgi:hypothetical protein